MNAFKWAAVALLVAGLASLAAAAGIESTAPVGAAITSAPDAAIVVIEIASIDKGLSAVGEFLDAVQPGMSANIRDGLSEAFAAYGDGVAIDSSSPVVIAIVPASTKEEVTPLIFLPLTDYQAWRTAWKARIETDKDGREYFEKSAGQPVYFKAILDGSYLAFCDDGAALSSALAGPALSADRVSGILDALESNVIVANASVPSLVKTFPDMVDDLEEAISDAAGTAAGTNAAKVDSSAPAAQPKGNALAVGFGKVARDLLAGVSEVYAGVNPSTLALDLRVGVTAVKGTLIDSVFSQQHAVDSSDFALLPEKPVMLFACSAGGPAVKERLKEFYTDVIDACAAGDENAAVRTLVQKTLDDMMSCGVFDNMTGALYCDSSDSSLGTAAIYRTSQPGKVIDSAVALVSDPGVKAILTQCMGASGMGTGGVTVSDEEIDGAPVKVFTLALASGSGERGSWREMLAKMFGGAIVTRFAAKGDRLLATMSRDGAAMKDLLLASKDSPGRLDMAKVARSTDGLGQNLSGVELVSEADYFAWVVRTMGSIFGGAGEPSSVPVTQRYVAFGWSFEGGEAAARVSVPTEEIRAIETVMLGVTRGAGTRGPAVSESSARERALTLSNLKRIGLAIGMYQYDHGGAMPESLQDLVTAHMLEPEVLTAAPQENDFGQPTATREDVYYARLKAPASAENPAAVPIAWEKTVGDDGRLVVLWLNLDASVVSAADLAGAVKKCQALYVEPPVVPVGPSDASGSTGVEVEPSGQPLPETQPVAPESTAEAQAPPA